MYMEKVLCWKCRSTRTYKIHSRQGNHEINGKKYAYEELYAICNECGEQITVPGLDDDNIRRLEQEYESKKEEDYVVGCHNENYMKPHICPVATGNWCRDYVKCRSLKGE